MILPENMDLSNSERYILSFDINEENYSFSLYNPVEDGSFFFHEITKKNHTDAFSAFKDFFYENDFCLLPYRKVFILNNTPDFTFVPNSVFDEKNKTDFLEFNVSENKGKLLLQMLRRPELTILHNMRDNVHDFFVRSFTNPKFIHHLSPLLSYFQERSKMGNANKLIINLNEKKLDIICYSPAGDLILGNNFEYNHLNDAAYYILFTWKQLNLNQSKDFMYIAGKNPSKNNLMEQMQKYIYNVIPVNISQSGHFEGVDTQNIPFELLALTLSGF